MVRSTAAKCLLFVGLTLAAVGLFAPAASGQDAPDPAKLEAEIATLRQQLADPATEPKQHGKILWAIASKLNDIGELRFRKGEYDLGTKAFVDADGVLKKYHEDLYAAAKTDLKDTEEKLAGFIADPNRANRDMLIATYRDLVRNYVDSALDEAKYFDDFEAQKTYLKRLNELAADSGEPVRQAEYFEKAGHLEFESGNSDAAFQLYNKALDIRQKAGKHEYWSLNYIAAAQWYLGDLDKALETFAKVIEITRRSSWEPLVFKPGASDTLKQAITFERAVYRMTLAQALLNTAQIHASRGSFGTASKAVDEVRDLIDKSKVEDERSEPETAAILNTTRGSSKATMLRMEGRLLDARGDEAGAIKAYSEAADLFRQLSIPSQSGAMAGLRARLASLYMRQGKFDDARNSIREAMWIRARLHQESGTTVALMQASRIELADKKIDAALKYAGEAKSSAAIVGLDDIMAEADEVEADALFAKAGTTSARMLDSAIRGYESAAKTYKQLDLRPFMMRVGNSLGLAYERAARPKDAETAYKQAIDVAEAMRTSFATSEESTSYSNRNDVTDIYRHLVDLLVKQGRAEEALQYATRAQRRDLIDAVPKSEVKLDSLRQVTAAAEREEAARSNLNNSRGSSTAVNATAQKSLANAIGAARQDYALAIKRLETEQPNLRFTVRPTDLLKLQSSVAPTEAIVSYLVTADRLYIFVVRRNAVAVRSVEISQNDLRVLVAQAREGIKDFGSDFYDLSSDPDEGFAKEKASADLRTDDASEHYKKLLAPVKRSLITLDDKLIAPINDLVGDAATLKIIPNAELFLLPFSALVSAKDNKYLIERHELIFLTAGDLINAPTKLVPAGQMVAFGDPTEANLDGALDEVKAIQKVFPRLQLFTEDKATKVQLFKLTSARIVHFATHGHIRTPLESSSIQLAHLPNLDSPDLSYGEIYALPLESTDMIVLSACETALGGVSGTEVGVFVEAFRTKTATVAASLWSVDDFATRELMVEFYKDLSAGQTRAAAMRAPQLKLLHDGRTKNPLFWAAFVLYGDGGKLSGLGLPRPGAAVK